MAKSALPRPNVSYLPYSGGAIDEESLKGMICNPTYAGLFPFPQLVSDEAWIKAASELIREEGPEQFLVNMLFVLRRSMADHMAHTAEEPTDEGEQTAPPRPRPDDDFGASSDDEPLVYCYHDGFPMLNINGAMVCVAEYLFEHLDNSPVTDIISKPVLTLVFQNGHTLPVLCPDCGQSAHVDEDLLLNVLDGLVLVDSAWDDETQALILDFGLEPGDAYSEDEPFESMMVHLDSVRRLTCPFPTSAHYPEAGGASDEEPPFF